jgi:hypothetical protein
MFLDDVVFNPLDYTMYFTVKFLFLSLCYVGMVV